MIFMRIMFGFPKILHLVPKGKKQLHSLQTFYKMGKMLSRPKNFDSPGTVPS